MISTVTTSTIASVTAIVSLGMVLGLAAVITLIVLLGVRELAAASDNGSHQLLARSLDIGIAPLIIAFVMIVAMEVVAILG